MVKMKMPLDGKVEVVEVQNMKVEETIASIKEAAPCGSNEAAVGDRLQDRSGKHDFSIELESYEQLSEISIPSVKCQWVLVEGSLGEIENIELVESVMLEIQCSKGTLRMDLAEEDYRKAIQATGGQER
jgi:hypothetical protein